MMGGDCRDAPLRFLWGWADNLLRFDMSESITLGLSSDAAFDAAYFRDFLPDIHYRHIHLHESMKMRL